MTTGTTVPATWLCTTYEYCGSLSVCEYEYEYFESSRRTARLVRVRVPYRRLCGVWRNVGIAVATSS
eukprot:scaffold108116_cov17-Prasinocladus_malaysianus.AAC.1